MSKEICRLDKRKELYLSMCWEPGRPHGICGHVYEIIDYYILLKNHMRVGILFCETILSQDQLISVINDKYDLPASVISQILQDTVFHETPSYVICNNIFFVDGSLRRLEKTGVKIITKKILAFKCSYLDTIYDRQYKDIVLFQDDRVYKDITPQDVDISIDYVKKINFQHYREVKQCNTNTGLIYATTNCRRLTTQDVDSIINNCSYDRYIIITNEPKLFDLQDTNITIMTPPLENIFDQITGYIYTPTTGRWDGSPRFPAECKFYNKRFELYNIDEQYLSHDRGLYYRLKDIETRFEYLHLSEEDSLIQHIHEQI